MTKREQQVLALIGRGYSIPQIADKLFRSQKTIETHRQSLGRKLGVSNRVELARIAIQTGLSPLDTMKPAVPHGPDDPRQVFQNDAVAAAAMLRIESACALVVGEAYCRALVEQMQVELGVAGAILGYRLDDEYRCRCVAGRHRDEWVGAELLDCGESPCRRVMEDGFVRQELDVAEQFPEWFAQMPYPVHSYMGVRLEDPLDTPWIGMLVVFQDEAAGFSSSSESVLRVCAVRAAAELSRIRLIDNLQSSVESLEARLAGGPEKA
ncbi:MAG: response regulator transcription factor [Planctomycetota bacterium]